MKIETYDKIFNSIVTSLLAFIVVSISVAATYLFLLGLDFGLHWLLSINIPKFLIHAIPWGFSFPFTFMLWASYTAVPNVNVSIRDFWIKFGHVVKLEVDTGTVKKDALEKEIEEWVNKNTKNLHRKLSTTKYNEIYYAFISKQDMVAFKLRWLE